ncbi:MAG: succinate dehydrogenase, hydrophobic membrane anchor protein [Neisseriaceae bacterium]
MVKRYITGAGYGFNSWLQQRITAIIMLVVSLVFIGLVCVLATSVNASFSSWQGLFNYTFTKIIVQLFFIALLIHTWVGVRDIWMDYIQNNALKLTLHIFTILWLFMSLIYSIKVIWQ